MLPGTLQVSHPFLLGSPTAPPPLMLLSIPLSLPQHTYPPPQFPSIGVRQEPPCQTLPLVPISTMPQPLPAPDPFRVLTATPTHCRSRPSTLTGHRALTLGPAPTGLCSGPQRPRPSSLRPLHSPLRPQPRPRPLPSEAPPTHSEAPSLVGDGPSAMAGLMVSAGRTGFLRASIGAPRPAAAPQPGPIGGGATRARGCGLGRRAAEGGRARGAGLSGPPPRPSEADAAPQPGGRGTGGGHEIAGRVLARSSPARLRPQLRCMRAVAPLLLQEKGRTLGYV